MDDQAIEEVTFVYLSPSRTIVELKQLKYACSLQARYSSKQKTDVRTVLPPSLGSLLAALIPSVKDRPVRHSQIDPSRCEDTRMQSDIFTQLLLIK